MLNVCSYPRTLPIFMVMPRRHYARTSATPCSLPNQCDHSRCRIVLLKLNALVILALIPPTAILCKDSVIQHYRVSMVYVPYRCESATADTLHQTCLLCYQQGALHPLTMAQLCPMIASALRESTPDATYNHHFLSIVSPPKERLVLQKTVHFSRCSAWI